MSILTRRLLAILVLAGGLAAPLLVFSSMHSPTASAVEVADLKDQLKNGLLVRRPEDHAFIDRVVRMVEQDQLPIDLVKSTFQWARRKKKPQPFPYFERALKLRAAEIGIRVE